MITTNVILIYDDLPKLCAENQGVKRIFAEGFAKFAISANMEIAIGGNSYFSLIYIKFKFCLAHIMKHNTWQYISLQVILLITEKLFKGTVVVKPKRLKKP